MIRGTPCLDVRSTSPRACPEPQQGGQYSTSTELSIASPARTVQACREESANRPRPVHNSSLLHFRIRSRESRRGVSRLKGMPSQASLDIPHRLHRRGGGSSLYSTDSILLCTLHGARYLAEHVSRQSIILYREQRSDQTVAQNSKCFPAHEKPWHVAQIGA